MANANARAALGAPDEGGGGSFDLPEAETKPLRLRTFNSPDAMLQALQMGALNAQQNFEEQTAAGVTEINAKLDRILQSGVPQPLG